MNKGKKRDRSCTDGAPIHINCKDKVELPLHLQELADLLAEWAVKQLNQQPDLHSRVGEKSNDDR